MNLNKVITWDEQKNIRLLNERGVGFEEVLVAIQHGHLLGIVQGKEFRCAHQRIFAVEIDGYTYAVPFVENQTSIFLKTIYASRVLHKKYHKG